jgi:hypothetical protein
MSRPDLASLFKGDQRVSTIPKDNLADKIRP